MKKTPMLAAFALAVLLASCVVPQRFQPQPQPQQYQRPPPPPTDGPPYTRQKEDELNEPAVPQPRPMTGRWKALPPEEYDRPYKGQLTIARGDARTMQAICPKTIPACGWL